MVAVADLLSDGLGMHLSKESQKSSTKKGIWQATFSTIIPNLALRLLLLFQWLHLN